MKTYHIKDLLKKDLLIVELPENGYYEVFKHGIFVKGHLESEREFIEGSYTLLGSPDEIKEEDARKLVQYLTRRDLTITPKNYSKGKDGRFEDITFTESLLSAIESEIYWENPLGFEPKNIVTGHGSSHLIELVANSFYQSWKKAQEKTFDKKRTLIFVKN